MLSFPWFFSVWQRGFFKKMTDEQIWLETCGISSAWSVKQYNLKQLRLRPSTAVCWWEPTQKTDPDRLVSQAFLIGLRVNMKKNNESTKNWAREKVKLRGGIRVGCRYRKRLEMLPTEETLESKMSSHVKRVHSHTRTHTHTHTHSPFYYRHSSRDNFIPSAKNIASLITFQTARLICSELSLCIQIHYLTC